MRLLYCAALLAPLLVSAAGVQADDLRARGEYLLHAGGCLSCHTDVKNHGPELAGGRALSTPFGVFYPPNITPDPETGLGGWSEADFRRALHEGLSPEGEHYFPAFPYPSYTRISDQDVAALWAYLRSLPPVRRANREHDIDAPFGWRWLVGLWKLLYFDAGRFRPDASRPPAWNRGAYLVEALAHCGECHTRRNALGALDRDMWLAGTPDGPEGERAPNITPDRETGIGKWSADELAELMKTGFKPGFDNVQGAMAETIEHGLKFLTDDDRRAIADYLLTLPPISHKVERKKSR